MRRVVHEEVMISGIRLPIVIKSGRRSWNGYTTILYPTTNGVGVSYQEWVFSTNEIINLMMALARAVDPQITKDDR